MLLTELRKQAVIIRENRKNSFLDTPVNLPVINMLSGDNKFSSQINIIKIVCGDILITAMQIF